VCGFVSPGVVARVVIIGLYTCCYPCDEIIGEELGTRLCLPGQGGIATGTTAERVFRTEAGRAVKLVSLLPGRVYLARYLPTYSCVLCAVRRTKRPPA
jgi:hypothetical protein